MGTATAVVALLAGCSVDVPDPSAPKTVQATPSLARPTIIPGHDPAAVAAADMTFAAGGTLAQGVPVGISDGLREAPGWKPVKESVAGESQYLKADGCLVSAKVRVSQWPLVAGDDRASTVELFKYLDASILPEYLKAASLRWGGDLDKPGPKVDVLVLEAPAKPGARATAVMARLFGKAGSSALVSISCTGAASLAAARADVAKRLLVVPPSN
ncbi:hypothetical protein V3C33_12025 [Micrococcaceae bacterium Sec5.7]